MSNKLNLQIGQGNGFNELNRYSVKFNILNNDSATVSLSALRVVSYGWFPQRNILTQFTSGINFVGNLTQFTSTVDPNYGISQNGIVQLNQTSSTYRVFHSVIDSTKINPQLTLNVPSGGSSIGTVSYINNTDSYFDIVIDSPAPTTGYSVSWFLPANYVSYTGSVTPLSNPTISITKLSAEYIRNKSKKADTQIIISWPGSTNTIPQNWATSGTDVYLGFNNNLFQSNDILSAWYSKPSTNVLDNPSYVLQQFDGANWNTVQEYETSSTPDTLTGQTPSDNYFVRFVSSGAGTSAVYIGPSYSNPISANTADKNSLFLNSKSNTDNRRRSLVYFNTSTIPSSSTSIKSAVLRLNVNALQNAYNYIGTSGTVGVYRVSNSWVENQVTWTKRTSAASWSVSGGDYVDSPALWLGNSTLSNSFTSADNNSQFWMDFDVTSVVDYWRINPSQNYGFLIKLFDATNENNSTNIQWTLNSNKDGGTGTILGYPELLVSYNVLNNSGPQPSLQIISPSNGQTVPTQTFNVTAESSIAGGNVETIDLYYRVSNTTNAFTKYGSLTSFDNINWSGSFPAIGVGSYDIALWGVSDLGIAGQSAPITISFTPSPTVTYTSAYLCHNGSINFQGNLDVTYSNPISGYLSYLNQDVPTNGQITKIIEDRINPNIVWVSTDGNGLFRIDKSSNTVSRYNSSNTPYNIDSITDINMESNGLLWISIQDKITKIGSGIVSFFTLDWGSYSSNDWSYYNKTNSPLSAYSFVDVFSIEIDSNDKKWISLNKNNVNSVITFSNQVFTSATTYSPGIYPRKIKSKNGVVYVASNDNRILSYNGSWTTVTLPSFSAINSIDVDSSNNVWVGTDYGLALISGTTPLELQSSATPSWNTGLNSNSDKLINKKINSVYIDSSSNKWLGFHTSNGSYNGGLVQYSTSALTSAYYKNSSNWNVYDQATYSGILSNNINQAIKTTDGSLWVATDSGLSVYNGSVWNNFSETYGLTFPLSISNGSLSSFIPSPDYGNPSKLNLVLDYGSGYTLTKELDLNIEKQINTNIIYPVGNLATVSAGTLDKLYSIDSDNYSDVSNGDTVTYKIYKSSNSNGPWILYKTYVNSLNPIVYDTLSSEDFFYLKTVVTNNNCSYETSPVAVYGRNNSVISLNSLAGKYTNNSILTVSGSVYNKDFYKNLNINGVIYNDSLSDVTVGYYTGATFNSVGTASISSIDDFNKAFVYDWVNPVVGVSSLTVKTTTLFGTFATSSLTFSAIQSVPTLTVLNPIENQVIPFNSSTILSAQGQYLVNSISAVSYHILSGSNDVFLGSATSGVGGNWAKTFTPSASFNSGYYQVYASGVDVGGNSNISNSVDFYINSLPTASVISNLSAIYSGNYSLLLKIFDNNGFFNNKVEILSGTSVYYSGYANGFGDFQWVWNSPVNGPVVLSAKVYDGNPSTSSDFNVYKLNFNLNSGTISLTDPGFSSAIYNGSIISPKVNVVKSDNNFNLSATVTGTNISGVNYWLATKDSNGNYVKSQLISAIPGSFSVYSSNVQIPSSRTVGVDRVSTYQFYGVIAELVSNNGSYIQSSPILFYSKDQSITGSVASSTCENPVLLSGSLLDSDAPYNTESFIIDNSVSAYIYDVTNSVKLSNVTISAYNNENIDYYYYWNSPTSSTHDLRYVVVDSYGLSSVQNKYIGQIETNPTINLLGLNGYISSATDFYVTSSTTLSISSTVSSSNVSSVSYNISYGDGSTKKIYATSANNYTSSFSISSSQQYALVNSELITNGNCDILSQNSYTIVSLGSPSATINYDLCSDCYCSQGALSVNGTITDNNFDNPYITNFTSGYIVSAILYDSFNNIVGDVSNQVTASNVNYSFSWNNPTLNATSLTLKLTNNYGLSSSATKNFYKAIGSSPTISVISPVDFSATNYVYKQNDDIVIATNNSNLSQLKIYENNILLTTLNNPGNSVSYTWSSDKHPGNYQIKIIGTDINGCSTQVIKNIFVANPPSLTILTPTDKSFVNVGSVLSASIDTKANNPASISAVKISYNGTLVTATNVNQSVWSANLTTVTSSVSSYKINAYSYDTYGGMSSATVTVSSNNIPLVTATISESTSISANYNSTLPVILVGISDKGSIAGFYVNGDFVPAINNSATYYIKTANDLIVGSNTLNITVVDTLNALGGGSLGVNVKTFSGNISYPTIQNIGSDPANKINYSSIKTTFKIYDTFNGIIPFTIGLASNSVGYIDWNNVVTNDNGLTYIVPVITSASGNIIISAMNYVGKSTSASENGFIIRCAGSRNLNLTNYLPQYLQQNFDGTASEFYQFTEFFENYLNTLYSDVDSKCNLSVLEKTFRLQNLHDIDKIDSVYIPQFADMMGYGVGINNDELGTFGLSMSGYSDSDAQYKDKILRFVVGNLPNWYSIKTTRNAVKIMLLSFGIIGDVVDKYTLDYDKYWKENRVESGKFVSEDIGSKWYPTPHISVGIDLRNTPNNVAYSSQMNKVLTAMEDIRPANVVIDGIQGFVEDIQMPICALNISFRTTKSITITNNQQINIK